MEDKHEVFLAALAGLAGSPIPSTRDEALLEAIVDRLDSIATAAGTAELPAVTSDDNGDVLTVVSGAWAKAAPSGGGGATVVHPNVDTGRLDMTAEELFAAAKSSFTILVFATDTEESAMSLAFANKFENDYIFVFGTKVSEAYAVFTADSGSDYPAEAEG